MMMTSHFAERMKLVKPSAIRELLKYGADPELISFAGGYPDPELFPLEQLSEVFDRAISKFGHSSLQYTVSNGIPRLREQLAQRMLADGVRCSADEVLVLQGAQQGLDLVGKMLIDRGDLIVTENPTFLGALIAFNPCEPRYHGISIDGEGLVVEELEALLATGARPKFLYTTPDFHNPTGVTLSGQRRRRLVDLANQFDFFILEDSPYREIRYEGSTVPSIKSFDTEGRVIFLGSFSKVLAPGLRIGWAVGAPKVIEALGLLKLAADTQTSTINMFAVSTFLDSYRLDDVLAVIRATYRRKKNLMLDTVRTHFPPDIAFTDPSGGLFTWLTFPPGFDAATFMREKALPVAKVAFVPGATFYPVVQEENHARLSYSLQSDAQLVEGIVRLAKVLKPQ
jgi:2-aminoadipate transaminase